MNIMTKPSLHYSEYDELLNKDRWHVEELGLEPDRTHSCYYLDFSQIKLVWLNEVAKRFVRFQSATKSYSSCRSYVAAIARFSDYLCHLKQPINPDNIMRELIINFYHYLLEKKFGVVTRRTTIIHIRTLHLIIMQEHWLPWPEKPLIYSSDIPKEVIAYPRYIPDSVINQLQRSLHHLARILHENRIKTGKTL